MPPKPAFHRVEILRHALALYELLGIRRDALSQHFLACIGKPGDQHMVHNRPHGTAPIAARFKIGMFGIPARHAKLTGCQNAAAVSRHASPLLG